MNSTHKKLTLLTLLSVVSCGAVVFTSIVNIVPGQLSPIAASIVNSSVTFTMDTPHTSTQVDGKYNNTFSFTNSNGVTFTCSITRSTTGSDSSYIGSLYAESSLTVTTSSGTESRPFQKVTSIVLENGSAYSRTMRFYVNGSSEYETLSVDSRSEGTKDYSSSSVRSFRLVGNSASEFSPFPLKKLVVNYECSTSYIDENILDSITLDYSGVKTSYTVGESFDSSGLIVTAHYTNLSSDIVTPTNISSPDMSSAGEKTITVSYTEGTITKTASFTITVEEQESGLSGTYAGTYTSFTFTTSSEGSYSYGANIVYFSYVIDGSSITFTYVSGSNTDLGNYMLFNGSATTNSTGKIKNATQISVDTYGPWGATSRTFTKS